MKAETNEQQLGYPLGFWVFLRKNDLLVLRWNAAGEQFDIENDLDPENIDRFRMGMMLFPVLSFLFIYSSSFK